jgi:hypothetical protein
MGYFFIFEMNKYLVKQEMQGAVRHKSRNITKLVVPMAAFNPDLQRPEKHEIRYKGNMYDVVSEQKSGDAVVFYCIRDHKEELLLAGMKKVNNSRYSLLLHDHLVKIALPLNALILQHPYVAKNYPQLYKVKLYSWFLNTWSPPPEIT